MPIKPRERSRIKQLFTDCGKEVVMNNKRSNFDKLQWWIVPNNSNDKVAIKNILITASRKTDSLSLFYTISAIFL